MVEVVQLPFRASIWGSQSLTMLPDWTTATSMVVLVTLCVMCAVPVAPVQCAQLSAQWSILTVEISIRLSTTACHLLALRLALQPSILATPLLPGTSHTFKLSTCQLN